MAKKESETFCPASPLEWRQWLEKNHHAQQSVWLVYYRKDAGMPTVSWSEAVDEALCFGWIDSTKRSIDDRTFTQFFCKRKPGSVWSKINKEKVERLIAEGRMMEAGHKSIATARENGSWALLDAAEDLSIPKDLAAAFKKHKGAEAYFLSLSKSTRKSILQWLLMAKRAETRQKRILETAMLAAQQQKPKQFR